MEGREDSRFLLLQPKNQIVRLERRSTRNGDQITLALDKHNLESLITSVSVRHQSFSLPVVFLSVLGNNKDGLRALHTDWLIHYYGNYGQMRHDIGDIYKSWHSRFGPPDQLKYVGQCPKAAPGVYIWPASFDITEETEGQQYQQLVGFVLYAHALGGQYHDPRSSAILDYLVASISQKVVVFKTSEKEMLVDFIKSMNSNTLPPLTSFVEAAGSLTLAATRTHASLARGWDAFVKSLKSNESILKGRDKPKNLPTLGNALDYMNIMINKINSPSQSSDMLLTNGDFGRNEDHIEPPRSPMFLPRPATYSTDSIPPEQNYNNGPVDTFRVKFQRWLTDEIKLPHDLRKIVEDLRMDQWGTMMDRLMVLQRIEQSYHLELQRMFDNYVCFSGNVDEKQIVRLQEAARQREKSSWTAAQNNSTEDPIVEMIRTGITKWLSRRYVEEHFEILENENKLGEQTCEKLARTYVAKMKQLMKESGGMLKLSVGQGLHRKMVNECCNMMHRCMRYEGRANNHVVTINMTILEQVLNDQFEDWRRKNMFYEDSPESNNHQHHNNNNNLSEDGIISAYMKEIDSKMSQYTATKHLENLHNATFKKLAGGVRGAGRDDLETILLSYLVYTSEHYQEQLQNFPNGTNPATICIHLTVEWIKVMVRHSNGWKVVKFQQQDTSNLQQPSVKKLTTLCPARVSWIRGKFGLGYDAKMAISSKGKANERDWSGTILNCIRVASQINAEMATDILKELFVQLCYQGEVDMAEAQAVLILPSWFAVGDRALLRRAADVAGLRKTFLVNETSLAAYHIFMENGEGKLVCVVIARMDAVRIEIFGGVPSRSEGKTISLLALAFGEWASEVMDPHRLPGNSMQVLEASYNRAICQLPQDKDPREMVCFLQTDNDDWRPELAKFFWGKQLILREEAKGEDFVDAAATHLCVNPCKIRALLLDYATPKIQVNAEHSNSSLSAEHLELLRKCQVMELQLNNREIKMGILTRKIAFETIERARLHVKLHKNTEKEEWELEELISIHKFKI